MNLVEALKEATDKRICVGHKNRRFVINKDYSKGVEGGYIDAMSPVDPLFLVNHVKIELSDYLSEDWVVLERTVRL